MHRLWIVVVLLLSAAEGAAQESSGSAGAGRGRFGAPVVRYTTIRGHQALMLGGRGGWNVSPYVVLGFGAYGTLNAVDAAPGALPMVAYPLDVKLETFGFDIEYAPRPYAPTHLTLAAFVGGGANHYYKDDTNEQEGETDFMLLLEPSVGVEQRVSGWLHLNLAASYRLVGGVEQSGLRPADVQVASVSLAAKIGRF